MNGIRPIGIKACVAYNDSVYRRSAVPHASVVRSKVAPTAFEPTREELQTAVRDAITVAKQVCDTGSIAECAVAWDIVEELSAAAADARSADPLERYCETHPSESECRTYDL